MSITGTARSFIIPQMAFRVRDLSARANEEDQIRFHQALDHRVYVTNLLAKWDGVVSHGPTADLT